MFAITPLQSSGLGGYHLLGILTKLKSSFKNGFRWRQSANVSWLTILPEQTTNFKTNLLPLSHHTHTYQKAFWFGFIVDLIINSNTRRLYLPIGPIFLKRKKQNSNYLTKKCYAVSFCALGQEERSKLCLSPWIPRRFLRRMTQYVACLNCCAQRRKRETLFRNQHA